MDAATSPSPVTPSPGDLVSAVARIRARISAAAERARRDPADVLLIGASKTVPVEVLRLAKAAGLEDFAENYVGELVEKSESVRARWHFIGKLQTGTVRHVVDHAEVVHSAEPGRAFRALARRAARTGRRIDALVEVDFTETRQGVHPDEVEGFAEEAAQIDGVRLVGLMTVPPMGRAPEDARPYFATLRRMRDQLSKRIEGLEQLSMGMSADYEVAVEEGATMVRIGTALFGPRPARAPANG